MRCAGDKDFNLHDFTAKSIKLLHTDPKDPTERRLVMLSLAHLVRMEPEHYVLSDGKRMVTPSDEDHETRQRRGIKRSFIIYDDIGGRYESHSASRETQSLHEQLWAESA
jgi:hypothetical protein